jgi:hypothetical protein
MTNTAEHGPRHSAFTVPSAFTVRGAFKARGTARERAPREPGRDRTRLIKGVLNTIPIVLVGSMALSMNLTGPIQSSTPKRADKPRATPSELGKAIRGALADAVKLASTPQAAAATASIATASVPSVYRVVAGDTVSSIAGK